MLFDYSNISDSSKVGGKIGWVKKNSLSDTVIECLKDLNIDEYSSPLNINNNCKQDIIVYLEKTEINDFINCEENSKGLIFEYYVNFKDIEKIKILLKYYPDYVNINNTDYFLDKFLIFFFLF